LSPQTRSTERTTRWRVFDARQLRLGPVHVRVDRPHGKKIWWENGEGRAGLNGHRLADLAYGGETIRALEPGALVVVTEGERCADAVRSAGYLALGLVCGAAATPGDFVLLLLAGVDVVLWPDADAPGQGLMARVAENAQRLGISRLRLVHPPADSPLGWDAADAEPGLIGSLIASARPLPPTSAPNGTGARPTGTKVGGTPGGDQTHKRALRSAANITLKRVHWLWTGRVATGKVTMLDGRPGLGKSAIAIDIAARTTRGGPMPGDAIASAEPRNVLLVTAEDDWEDTVVLRLIGAGADLSRVYRLDELIIPEGVSALGAHISVVDAGLVVIDPLVAFVASRFNLYRDQDARAALRPLADVAGRTGAAILGLRHVNKAQGIPAQDRGTGSVAIGGAARSNLIAGPDPDQKGSFVLASIKNNLGPKPPSLGYSLQSIDVELPDGASSVVVVRWHGDVHVDADDLVIGERQGEAAAFIEEQLAGGPKPSNDIRKAAESRGLSWSGAVRRASERLRVSKYPEVVGKPGGKWVWALPDR
jgi:hypothetical protein